MISLAQRMAAAMLYQNAAQSAASCVSAAQEGVPAVSASPVSAKGAENSVRGNAEDDASKAEIAEDVFSDPQKAPVVHHFEAPPEVSETVKVWRKIGGGSLAFSLIFHAVLIFFAIFYVVSTYVAPPEEPPSFFATGSGGGRGG